MAKIVSGKDIKEKLLLEIREEVAQLQQQGVRPTLALVQVGEHAESSRFVASKRKLAESVGLQVVDHHLPATVPQAHLEGLLQALGAAPDVHGVLCQLPLPGGMDTDRVLSLLPPEKDVDGLHPINAGLLAQGRPRFVPCTPLGVLKILEHHEVVLPGARVTVVGRSALVGRPLAHLLTNQHATVTLCHSHTQDLALHTRNAEILISATGVPGLIRGHMIQPGAVVIDVGLTYLDDPTQPKGYRLAGDVVFAEVEPLASLLTPVPGGVGPLTVTLLLANTVEAAKRLHSESSRRSGLPT